MRELQAFVKPDDPQDMAYYFYCEVLVAVVPTYGNESSFTDAGHGGQMGPPRSWMEYEEYGFAECMRISHFPHLPLSSCADLRYAVIIPQDGDLDSPRSSAGYIMDKVKIDIEFRLRLPVNLQSTRC